MANNSNMGNSGLKPKFYLADWCVDTRSNRIIKEDIEVKLESKVMDVLVYLAQRAGDVVTREELEKTIWGGTVVGYEALTGSIAKLRKVLDDEPKAPRFIETISKKGYRLIASVSTDEIVTNATASRSARMPGNIVRNPYRSLAWGLGLAVLAIAIASIGTQFIKEETAAPTGPTGLPSIVVLPFSNLSKDLNQKYFANGMTADITTALSKLSGLFVIAPASASTYRGDAADIRKIADSLGVQYVLEGSVRRTADRLRVNIHLIDATRNIYLWSEKFDREVRQVFDVQDDITRKIIDTLAIKLTEEEKRRTARRYTTNTSAYDDFLQGQAHYILRTREDNQLAREFFQRAIIRDASFARAYSAMALTYVAEYRYDWGKSTTASLDKALELAIKSVRLDNELPQAHWVLGYVHVFRQQYDKAEKAASRAVELDPNYADSYLTLAICHIHSGSPENALHLVKKAMLLNPQYPAPYASVLGQAHFFMKQYNLSVPALREAIRRNENLLTAHLFLIVALSKMDQAEEARWVADNLRAMAPEITAKRFTTVLPVKNADTLADMRQHLERAGL